ncbi:casein kinase, putative [Bodo saltans]|uniref:Casein kinase, putative n=1 Tax=Bodo saltans TaxID=75058 RepID=A0A0S4INH5_BODSA|nr:casein kinase, putative [Bodo saltans]|eukprot:CUE88130.1 casein kinase, putative [Bodo saltans]
MSAIKERRKGQPQRRVIAIDGNFVLERLLTLSAAQRVGPIGQNTVAWIPPTPESLLASSTKSSSAPQRKQPAAEGGGSISPAATEHLAASWQRDQNYNTMSWAHPLGESEDLAASTAPTAHTRSVEKTVSWTAIGSNTDEQSAGLTHVNTATFTNTNRTIGMSLGNSLLVSGSSSFGTGGGGAFANFLSMSLMQSSVIANVANNTNGVTASGLGYFTYHDEIEAGNMPIKAYLGRDCSSNERVIVWMQKLPRSTNQTSKTNNNKLRGDRSPQVDSSPLPQHHHHTQGRGTVPTVAAHHHHHRASTASSSHESAAASNPSSHKFGTTRGILHVMGTHIQALLRQKVLDVEDTAATSSPTAADPVTYIPGIPRLLYFDTEGDERFQCLVQPALGPTLLSLVRYCGGRLSLRTVLMLGIQLLELLKHCAECKSRGVEGGSTGTNGAGMTLNDISPSTLRFGASSVDHHVLYMSSFAHCAAVGSNGCLPPLAAPKPVLSSPAPPAPKYSTSASTAQSMRQIPIPPQNVTIPAAAVLSATAAEGNPMTPGLLGSSLLPPPTLVVDDASGGSGRSIAALFTADPLNISAVSHNSQFAVSQSSISPSHALSMLGSSFVSTVTTERCRLARENNLAFGSARFHLGMPLSLADDAESVAYVLVYCLTGSLPWLSNQFLIEREQHDVHHHQRGTSSSCSTASYVPSGAVMAQLERESEFLATHPQQQPALPPALSNSIRTTQRATVLSATPSATDLFARHLFRMKEQYACELLHSSSNGYGNHVNNSCCVLLAKAAAQEISNPMSVHSSVNPGAAASTHLNPPTASSASINNASSASRLRSESRCN